VIRHADAMMLRWAMLSLLGVFSSLTGTASPVETGSEIELLALDERGGRAVIMDVAGATSVLQLDNESRDGLHLKSVAGETALIELRFKASGETVAYRLRAGERVRIRPPQEDRSGGISVIAVSPEVRTGVKDSSSSAKD
jgi:hypothetical protein